MKTTIPFAGFYESMHSANIERAEEQLCTPYDSVFTDPEVLEAFSTACNYRKVYLEYAKAYSEELGEKAGIKWKFERMDSPREYNFSTDRIFCDITQAEVKRLFKAVSRDYLEGWVKDTFTSRSGFTSFYSADLAEWGDVKTWDHNQVGCLVEAYIDEIAQLDGEFISYDLMSDYLCNGYLESWLCAATPNHEEILAPVTATCPTDNRGGPNLDLEF